MTSVKLASLRLESGESSVEILPSLGGKIASIRAWGQDLLQSPLRSVYTRSRTMLFESSDASGWDECLPSVAACDMATSQGVASISDHGDLWRVPWTVCDATAKSCTLIARCFSLPLELQRTAALMPAENGFRLSFHYSLRNYAEYPAPWAWAAHPLFAVEPGDRILLPDTIHKLRLEYSRNGRLGEPESSVQWPIAALLNDGRSDLSKVQTAEKETAEKLFAGPLAEGENWCALERKSARISIRVSFDPAATPFLGLWCCYGGWPQGAGLKQMCVALEPSTTPVDSLARAGAWLRMLMPGETTSWWMTAEVHRG